MSDRQNRAGRSSVARAGTTFHPKVHQKHHQHRQHRGNQRSIPSASSATSDRRLPGRRSSAAFAVAIAQPIKHQESQPGHQHRAAVDHGRLVQAGRPAAIPKTRHVALHAGNRAAAMHREVDRRYASHVWHSSTDSTCGNSRLRDAQFVVDLRSWARLYAACAFSTRVRLQWWRSSRQQERTEAREAHG